MYVGKTSNMTKRKSRHKTQIGTHSSAIPVDVDMSKIEFNVVSVFDNEEEALKYEDQLIQQYNTLNGGWNKHRSGLICSDREYVLAHKRDYNAAHKEEKAAYMRDYNAAHKEERTAYKRNYYQTHREEWNAYMRAYRARKKMENML